MPSVSSRQNPWFKRVRDAIRDHDQEIAMEGPKWVADALRGGWKPLALFTRGEADLDATVPDDVPRVALSAELFEALAETRAPQNVIALFERPRSALRDFPLERGPVVALDGVQDPGNVGTIMRLAAAFDCAGVALLPGCADPLAPKAIRASAGAVLSVPFAAATLNELQSLQLPLFAADAQGADAIPPRRSILVLGSEGGGISQEVRGLASPVRIVTSGRVESLNVAAAAAILLARSFEQRQRR